MAYEIFEKNGVIYKLFMGTHSISSYPMIGNSGGLKDLDALVLENGTRNLKTFMDLFMHNTQYKELFENIPQENPGIKIYDVDFPVSVTGGLGTAAEILASAYAVKYGASALRKGEISRREVLKRTFKLGTGILGLSLFGTIINGLYNGEDVEIISEVNAVRSSVLVTPRIGFRNAVVARKIENYIVPAEKTPEKRLNVGILFGAAHSGIEHCIRYTWLRDRTIQAYKLAGYPCTSKSELNKVRKLAYTGKGYVGEEISTNLF